METFLFVLLGLLVFGSGLAFAGLVLTAIIAVARRIFKPAAPGKLLPTA
ncbi:hypothetical protein JL100_035755 (plasmid) [Skermanella mucosa]|nr:hypothetical protein [Skermanella mucosa]UEM25140.1 hypothetical protein JL100_035755 [Skermanella mucosa]